MQALKAFKEGFSTDIHHPDRLPHLRKQLQLLDVYQQKTVVFLFDFLCKVVQQSHINQMTSHNLGICWGPTLFRTGAVAAPVVQALIDEYDNIFRILD
eukprot:TRINITY_DN25936_c0_g1_i1.p1 TRINITY_DN25936_c0_g1~~TRINITY_DN25936_c0_g1_i1.p1  ORF type:complete len:112 (-),score=8.58 TRINITY_DN25936_c0_g1_i1:42-335(-)